MRTSSIVVVDASAAVAALVPGPLQQTVRELLLDLAGHAALVAPSGLFDAEVLNGLRKAWLRGALTSIAVGLEAFLAMPVQRVEVSPLILRVSAEAVGAGRVSGQDAVYLATALVLNASLLTLDTGLASAASRVLGEGRVLSPKGEA